MSKTKGEPQIIVCGNSMPWRKIQRKGQVYNPEGIGPTVMAAIGMGGASHSSSTSKSETARVIILARKENFRQGLNVMSIEGISQTIVSLNVDHNTLVYVPTKKGDLGET